MKKIFSVFVPLMLCMSCSGFLTENPTTSLSSVYDTETALETNVRGIIRSLEGPGMYASDMLENLQSCSGLVHWGSVSGRIGDERWDCVLRCLNYSSMSLNITMYGSFYTAINNCNILIDALPSSPVDTEYKKEIEAEAKLYRAYLYFTLVRLYGDVPLSLGGISQASSYKALPRAPYCEVYAQVLKDLETAFENMRSPERVAAVTGTQGRPNRWAARAVQAVVYLQIASILSVPQDENFYDPSKPGRIPDFSKYGIMDASDAYDKAYKAAKDVIDNGPYKLAWNYADLFKWTRSYTDHYGKDCWNLDERILVIQSTGHNSGNVTAMRTLPQYPEGSSVKAGTSISRHSNIRPTRFFFQQWCRMTGGVKGEAGSARENMYIGSPDPRLDLSLFHTSYKRSSDGKTVSVYPASGTIEQVNMGGSMPFYRKYWSPTYSGIPDVADLYLLRFSEMYYVAAEAAARLGRSDEAYDLIDKVHERARRSDPSGVPSSQPAWNKGQFASADEFVTALIWDKLFEFCGEDHEFFEVRRLGAKWFSDQVIQPVNAFLSEMDQWTYRDTYYGGSFQFETDYQKLRASLLCEFPKDELALNPAMTPADKNDFSWE